MSYSIIFKGLRIFGFQLSLESCYFLFLLLFLGDHREPD